MRRGLLPGAMALSAKFVPVVQSVTQRTVEAVHTFVADPAALSERVQEKVASAGAAVREQVDRVQENHHHHSSGSGAGAFALFHVCMLILSGSRPAR